MESNDHSLTDARVRMLPYIVAATFFMEYLDTTIIATALPQMAQSFGVGPNELSLGMTAYMLTLAVFIPISGWVADRLGSRTVFSAAIVIFTLASILCGFSQNVVEFTAARVLQGLGGAMMVPVGRMIVVRSTSKANLMKAIATITWPAIVAPVVGPSIGGFIVTYASWHWIFLMNVPFGIAAFAAVMLIVRNDHGTSKRPLDLVGFVLSGAALTSLLYGTEIASHMESNLKVALGFIAGGIVLGWFAYRHAQRAEHPLLDFSNLKIPTYSVTVVTGSLTRIGIDSVPYLMPLMFQIGFGLSAFQSGLLLLATALGNLGMKAFTTRVLRRFGFRRVAVSNAAIAGCLIIACGLLTPDTPVADDLGPDLLLRPVAFNAVLDTGHAGLRRHQRCAQVIGQHLVECGAADDHRDGDRLRRAGAAYRRLFSRRIHRCGRRAFHVGRFPMGVCHGRCDHVDFGTGLPRPGARCRQQHRRRHAGGATEGLRFSVLPKTAPQAFARGNAQP